jgi:P-type Cu+ transporter
MDVNDKIMKLDVEGMTCNNCAQTVTSFLEKEGLSNISVSFVTNEVLFEKTDDQKLEKIKKGIKRLGYTVVDNNHVKKKIFTLETIFIICTVLTVPLLLHMFFDSVLFHSLWFQLILTTPVFILGWIYFGKSAIGSIRIFAPNMDVLILLGATAAYGYSIAGVVLSLGNDFVYFETAATIITLVLLGNLIEKKTIKQTTTSIENLSKLKPEMANLIIDVNGIEMVDNIAIEKIKSGDIIRVNTGDRIPLDGRIIFGNGFANESMITGESIPVEKHTGDNVISGTLLQQGSLKIEVTSVSENSYVSKLIELVKNAHSKKPDIQRIADKVSNVFVPVVIAISLFTFLTAYFYFQFSFTQSLLNSVAVLVIACPCAMGLATPTAIMVGLGRVAGKGILIKSAKTVEQLSGIRNIVFDKTGTLTTGNFIINQIKLFTDVDESEVKSIVYSLEQFSSHPIASSIKKALQGSNTFSFVYTEEIKGKGMRGTDEKGNVYWFGSSKILNERDKAFDLYLTKNDDLIAAFDIQDDIKYEAKEIIAFLKSRNIKVHMLSGDSRMKCENVARRLGINSIYAEISPEDKLRIISELSALAPTAMVGDGINDAPALARATIGISLNNASEAAIDSSQVILLNDNLIALKQAFLISRFTFSTIKQNLFWALSYNIIAIPVAASGFLSPMVAALSMAFSDVVVIGNSLLLKLKKID